MIDTALNGLTWDQTSERKAMLTAYGAVGGAFVACWSNYIRHEPVSRRFPRWHGNFIIIGSILGFGFGYVVEQKQRQLATREILAETQAYVHSQKN